MTESLPDGDVGRPPQPPFITLLGVAAAGKMLTDLPPRGSVAEVLLEELRVPRGPGSAAAEVNASAVTKYDEEGRLVEETGRQNGVTTVTISRYEGARLVSQESTFSGTRVPRPKAWNYWTYDTDGKLTEYRRGAGEAIQNHDANFKRDPQGRLMSFDYRQGAKDELFNRTEYRYSADGRTVDISTYDSAGQTVRSTTQVEDNRGRVSRVTIHEFDWKTKAPNSPVAVSFRYDEQGRVVEQKTEDPDFQPAGSENALPPGIISISYDDTNHTKTTTYTARDGTIAATVSYDSDGAAIGISVNQGGQTLRTKLQCSYDDRGNWTSCQQMLTQAGVSAVNKAWRRTITYR